MIKIIDKFDQLVEQMDAYPDYDTVLSKQFHAFHADLAKLLSFNPANDDKALIENRYLCAGGSLIIQGPTGVGKSSLIMQMAIAFCLGNEFLGLKPKCPLRVLIVQAENDHGDLAEMMQGVMNEMDISGTWMPQLEERLHLFTNTSSTGMQFVDMLYLLHQAYQPDIIFADPLFSYLGSDMCNQGAVTRLLRNGVGVFMADTGCAVAFVHHTKKPKNDDNSEGTAYAGYGTSELANWARAIINLERSGPLYKLVFSKRGGRTGIAKDGNESTPVKYIKHSNRGICWIEASQPEIEESRTRKKNVGMFSEQYSPAQMAQHHDPQKSWIENKKLISQKLGCCEATVNRKRQDIEALVNPEANTYPTGNTNTVEHGRNMEGHGHDTVN